MTIPLHRRAFLGLSAAALAGGPSPRTVSAEEDDRPSSSRPEPLTIKDVAITPIALPDPPLLAHSGCHGPYFLRNIIEVEVDGGIVGIGETKGGIEVTRDLERARELLIGRNVFSQRALARDLGPFSSACVAGIELACLDACGKATGRRLCELLGGPVREQVEFSAYLFYRYASDHPRVLDDPRLIDDRGRGDKALDDWGEVRTPEALADEAERFRTAWGFRVFKLKAGVLDPDRELETLRALRDRLGARTPLRIDPNGRWTVPTALRIGRALGDLALEYYEDPVLGQGPMADVRRETGLPTSTNMCVTRFEHVPEAIRVRPVDVVLADHHSWGGLAACQALGSIAEAAGWALSQHSNSHAGVTMAAMIQLGAVVPQITLASDTHYPWLVEDADILRGPKLPIRDGLMDVPIGPGLGVDLDPDKVARAHEVYRKSGMTGRDDEFTMLRIDPNWRSVRF